MARRSRKLGRHFVAAIRISKRLLKFCFWFCVSSMLFSATLVLTYKWMTPPKSGIQIQRQIESNGNWQPNQVWVAWQDINPVMAVAVIASEDQRFLDHAGFDTVQIQKAIKESQQGERLRGASTITQQTAKNVFLWNGRSFFRKGLEAWFTLLIELFWSKQRILEVYLNSIEFGSGVFGVEAACQQFYGKKAKDINAYEAALLAAVLPNPHRMHADNPSPYLRTRQYWIVNQIRQLGGEKLIEHLD